MKFLYTFVKWQIRRDEPGSNGMIYQEIIQKEVEKHQLVVIGAISDLCAIKEETLASFDTQKPFSPLIKTAFLNYFYKKILSYGQFISKEKKTNEQLKRYCRRAVTNGLNQMRNEQPALLDQEMKTGSLTIAYHLSDALFLQFYQLFCQSSAIHETPAEVCSFFRKTAEKEYPIQLETFVRFLEKDDTSFWEVTCRYIQDLSTIVGSFALQKLDRPMYHDIIADNTWSDTYEIMRRRLVNQTGTVPVFQSGKDFRNYIIKTCHFLISNLHKRHTGKESSIEEYMLLNGQDNKEDAGEAEDTYILATIAPDEIDEAPVEVEMIEHIKELEIDVDNPYEVAYAVSIILLNTSHPLHQLLTEGIEDKVTILIEKTVNGMSYNDIVLELYGDSMGKEAFLRAVAKARKDYERVRKTLTERLIGIIANRKK